MSQVGDALGADGASASASVRGRSRRLNNLPFEMAEGYRYFRLD